MRGIYVIINTQTGKAYVGQTVCLRKRFSEHKRTLRLGVHYNSYLQRAWTKYGEGAFVFKVLLPDCPEKHMDAAERDWIAYYKQGAGVYNAEDGGHVNKHLAAETCRKISEGQRGRKLSAETRLRISLAHRGKLLTSEHRKAISSGLVGKMAADRHPQWGRKLSEDRVRKLAAVSHTPAVNKKRALARVGKRNSAATKSKMSLAAYARWAKQRDIKLK